MSPCNDTHQAFSKSCQLRSGFAAADRAYAHGGFAFTLAALAAPPPFRFGSLILVWLSSRWSDPIMCKRNNLCMAEVATNATAKTCHTAVTLTKPWYSTKCQME